MFQANMNPLPVSLFVMATIAACTGIFCGLLVYWVGLPKKEGWDLRKWNPFRIWAQNQFNFDSTMMGAAVEGGADVGNFLWKEVDAGAIDGAVNVIAKLAMVLGGLFRKVQTGFARSYALMMLFGGVLLLGYAAIKLMGGGQ